MRRVTMQERAGWKQLAREVGFLFHTIDGKAYWDETGAYVFTLDEIERNLEDPTAEIEAMCIDLVHRVVGSEELLAKLKIPKPFWDLIRSSWYDKEKNLYGRLDLSYSGNGPAKLLEYNADTPTSVYEAGTFQWWWLEDQKQNGRLPKDADQFNSLEDKLLDAFRKFGLEGTLHFSHVKDHTEDEGTVTYLAGLAKEAGLETQLIAIEDIGVDAEGRFTDLADRIIYNLFKLYPYEWMVHDEFGKQLLKRKARIIEPPWKMILSNKGMLPLLWKFNQGHPNLLPTYFEGDSDASTLGSSYVRKPLYSREGANVEIIRAGKLTEAVGGDYGAEGFVVQELCELPRFETGYPVIGSWVVASQPAGIGIREDNSLVTRDSSRFIPHYIEG
jgi:glutathionylspermidine synthase